MLHSLIIRVCAGHNVHAQVLDRKHEQMRRLYVQLAAAAGKDKANHTRTDSYKVRNLEKDTIGKNGPWISGTPTLE